MIYWISRLFCIVFFKIFCRVEAYGRNNIPSRGGFVLASNHVSYLDPVMLGICCPRGLHYIAKEELFKNRIFGWLLHRLNVFPVRRQALSKDTINKTVKILKASKAVVIFPEGTRSKDGSLQDAQAGVGFLASLSGVPVVPAYVKGSAEALPRGAKFIKPAKVKVYFGRPIDMVSGSGLDKKELYKKLSGDVMQNIAELKNNS